MVRLRVVLNSLDLGIQSTFNSTGEEIESIWVWNPFLNLIKPFTPFGLGVTASCALIIRLITKKGFSRFFGYKFIRDKRGFDILPDGTILGKIKGDSDDDDKYSEYADKFVRNF